MTHDSDYIVHMIEKRKTSRNVKTRYQKEADSAEIAHDGAYECYGSAVTWFSSSYLSGYAYGKGGLLQNPLFTTILATYFHTGRGKAVVGHLAHIPTEYKKL